MIEKGITRSDRIWRRARGQIYFKRSNVSSFGVGHHHRARKKRELRDWNCRPSSGGEALISEQVLDTAGIRTTKYEACKALNQPRHKGVNPMTGIPWLLHALSTWQCYEEVDCRLAEVEWEVVVLFVDLERLKHTY